VTRAGGISRLTAIEAATALLWLSPAEAGDRSLPGATVESVIAIAENLNSTVAAASLDSAALHMVGAAGVLDDPRPVLDAWDVKNSGVGKRRYGDSL